MGPDVRHVLDVALIHQAAEWQAAVNPDHVAIDEGDRQCTYGELAGSMKQLAGALRESGVRRNDRIAFLIDNGIEACKAMHAILRADCCFVSLNPAFPALRLASIVEQAGPKFVVTVAAHAALLLEMLASLPAGTAPGIVVLDSAATEFTAVLGGMPDIPPVLGRDELAAVNAADLPENRNTEEDLAYILFTSGTTGQPKGVMVTHRAIKATILWGVSYFQITRKDRLANHSRLSFDVSLFDIFCAFFAGATVCPLTRPGDCAFPGGFIRAQRITVWFSVPSVIGMMIKARQLEDGAFPDLRAALFAGEPLSPDWVARWLECQPGVPIYNLYGPTEAAIVCTVHEIGVDSPFDPDAPVPIGHETRDSELLVLRQDEDLPAAPDEVGRLFICGTQLAAGYWRQPALTANSFRINPLKHEFAARMYDTGDLASRDKNGVLHFAGRRDLQVKIHGYRIELGEIEVVLGRFGGVREAAALYVPGDEPEIVAVVVIAGEEIDEEGIRTYLEGRLPRYMVPNRFYVIADLPRNASGKVDRQSLLASYEAGSLGRF